jgi:hypothetical protein
MASQSSIMEKTNTFPNEMIHITHEWTLLGDVAKFTLYFTRILSELGQIHYMKSW